MAWRTRCSKAKQSIKNEHHNPFRPTGISNARWSDRLAGQKTGNMPVFIARRSNTSPPMSVYAYFLPTFLQSICLECGITPTYPYPKGADDDSLPSCHYVYYLQQQNPSEPEHPSQKSMTSPPRTPTKTLNLSIYSKF